MPIRQLAVVGLIAALAFFPLGALAGGQTKGEEPKPTAVPATEGTSENAPASREGPLAADQEIISRRYKRFEDTLRKIAESLRKTDPDRADLLIRALGKSTE